MGTGQFIDAGGINTYYETRGSGEPVLLLHGAFSNASDFELIGPPLSEHFSLVVPERRGHGHTADVDGQLSYDAMAHDTVAFMDALGVESAHLVGYSDGANIGMLIAMSDPGRVRKLVSISGNFRANGVKGEARAFFEQATPQTLPPMFAEEYAKYSPDGADHFPIMFEKTRRMVLNEPNISPEALGRIPCPTLVLCADDDLIELDHTIELFRSIPGAQLCVIPGASHLLVAERPALVATIIDQFLMATESSKIEIF